MQFPQSLSQLFDQFRFQFGIGVGLAGGVFATAMFVLMKSRIEKAIDWLCALLGTWFQDRRWKKRYLKAVFEEHRYLKFVGVAQALPLQHPTLQDVFVNLELQPASQIDPNPSEERTITLGRIYAIEGALAEQRCLAILGSPGSGKTTLLEHLCCAYSQNSKRLGGVIPIYIPLRRFNYTGITLIRQLTDPAAGFLPASLLASYPNGFFDRQMAAGKCILLLDGLDEVLEEGHHVAAARLIESLALAQHTCHIVVTSRIAGWRNLLSAKFARFIIRDLTKREVQGLVSRWHSAVIRKEIEANSDQRLDASQLIEADKIAAANAAQMLAIIESSTRIQQIASTPLLLSLMCLVYHTQRDLPRKRAKLYDQCVTILLDLWDRNDKQLQHLALPHLKNKLELMERLALHFYDARTSELRHAELIKVIEGICQHQGLQASPSQVLSLLEQRSGLISEKGRNVFAFSHLTFQEYFTACGLVRDPNGLNRLIERFQDDKTQEVVLLYSGITEQSDSLIETLLSSYSKTGDANTLLTCGAAAVEAQLVSASTKSTLVKKLTEFFDNLGTSAATLERLQPILAELGVARTIIRKFGDFTILEELGSGGFARVFRAMDRTNAKEVALKVYNNVTFEQMQPAAKAIQQLIALRHPNIVAIHNCGTHEGAFFAAMDYVPGIPLSAVSPHNIHSSNITIYHNNTPVDIYSNNYLFLVIDIALDIAKAMKAISMSHLLHGDINPSNIVWTGSKAVLLDFGLDSIVYELREPHTLGGVGYFKHHDFGTATMGVTAPEVFDSGRNTASADVFSFGMVIKHILGVIDKFEPIHPDTIDFHLKFSEHCKWSNTITAKELSNISSICRTRKVYMRPSIDDVLVRLRRLAIPQQDHATELL